MLYLCSHSTKRFNYHFCCDACQTIHSAPTLDFVNRYGESHDFVVAVGGGSVIDSAKIIAKKRIIAVPTTLAGASQTKHAVYWDNMRKCNYKTKATVTTLLFPEWMKSLPEEILMDTYADCYSHYVEGSISVKSNSLSKHYIDCATQLLKSEEITDLLNASILIGNVVELVGTNLIHALSYPITGFYGIPHGRALRYVLPRVCEHFGIPCPVKPFYFTFDVERVVDEALTYSKVYQSKFDVDKKVLMEIMKSGFV